MTESSPTPLASAAPDAPGAPARLRTNTWPMWLLALLPLTGLLTDSVGFGAPLAAQSSEAPGLRITVDVVPLVIGLLLAAADRHLLTARGVPRPLHWAWAVIGPVYVIGRSVVVRRRARGSLAPLWVWLVVSSAVVVVGLLRH